MPYRTPECASSVSQLRRNPDLSAKENNPLLWSVLILVLVIVTDQLTKLWAVASLTDSPSVEVLGQFFMLTLVYNEGGAMGTNFGSSTVYLISSILILLFVLYYTYINRDRPRLCYALAFITGGAVGNIIDRVRLGRVVDFLDVDFFDIDMFGYTLQRWWTFNIADAAITCSIVYLLIYVIFLQHRQPSAPAKGEAVQE
ncbi:MAG: signal peptidase II [candidate division Zixibacteria bacterium]|nr:signal peptidase II [candidate division Zixibacteria bacterium]